MNDATGFPRMDPTDPISPVERVVHAFLRSPIGPWFGATVAARVDPFLLRASKGTVSVGLGLPTAILTGNGARSGQRRNSAVLYFTDGNDAIIAASNFGGARHPAWYHNLLAHPEVELTAAGITEAFSATVVTEPKELERLWALADRSYPLFPSYRRKAAAAGRTIPLVRLTPV